MSHMTSILPHRERPERPKKLQCMMESAFDAGTHMIQKFKTACIPVAAVAMMSLAATANAQWDPYPWKRMPRTPDGKVDMNAPAQRTSYGKIDLSGFWQPENQIGRA